MELIDQVLDTNLRAPFLLSCEVARRLIDAELPGRIVNISSIGGFHYGGGGAALYSISKAGREPVHRGAGGRVVALRHQRERHRPGLFASEMSDGMIERMGDLTRVFPRRRIGQPENLDSTLLYLVSPASEMVTGTVVKVDDGQGPR